jgi:Fe-S-cluster-containing dehydrogenase component
MVEEQIKEKEELSKNQLLPKSGTAKIVMPIKVALSKGVLVVDESICAGCQNCMYACTLFKDGIACPELARIQLNTRWINQPHCAAQPCQQCVDPQCMRYCPTKAIKVDDKTGARVIDETLCIGCQSCIQACPYGISRIRFDKVRKKAIKCDLCGGNPACVKSCPTGALTYYTNPSGVRSGYIQPKGRDQ